MSSHCNLDEDEQPGDELERAEAGAGVLKSAGVKVSQPRKIMPCFFIRF